MHVGFVLLAFSTALDITMNKGDKAWPPEFGSNKLTSFKEARVAGKFVVMTSFKDGMAEGVVSRDINTAFVGEDFHFNLPVGKTGVEWKGNILMHRLKCL